MLLLRLIGLLILVAVLAGVGQVFWNAMHPITTPQSGSPYSTEGGHDPNRQFLSTQDELKFRGANLDTKKFK